MAAPNPPNPGFVSRLAEALGQSKFRSNRQLAPEIGVTNSTLCCWFRGAREPEARHIYRLAKVLGVRADWLLSGEGPREPSFDQPANSPADLRSALELFVEQLGGRIVWVGKKSDEIRGAT